MHELVGSGAEDAISSAVMLTFDDWAAHRHGPTLRAALKNATMHAVSTTTVTINAISCQLTNRHHPNDHHSRHHHH